MNLFCFLLWQIRLKNPHPIKTCISLYSFKSRSPQRHSFCFLELCHFPVNCTIHWNIYHSKTIAQHIIPLITQFWQFIRFWNLGTIKLLQRFSELFFCKHNKDTQTVQAASTSSSIVTKALSVSHAVVSDPL